MTEAPLGGTSPTVLGDKRASERPGGPASLVGLVLSGRYRIGRLLGEGGMGVVYEAEHMLMRKRLAIKVLHPAMSAQPEVVTRFEREAMASAHIDHPNVALATDFGKLDDGSFFLVLEFVEGRSLRAVLDEGRIEVGRALHILQQIAAPLVRAHGMGIVHRDLKPENVMLVERDGDPDFVKVLDFGIAKVPAGDFGQVAAAAGRASRPALTQVGMIYGTPEYMAPEQALGATVDGRADLYALGIVAYEMLTGHRPFDGEGPLALIGMHITAPVPPMAEKAPAAAIPPEVEALVRRLLAKESAERPADARELQDTTLALLAALAASGQVDARYLPPASLPRSSHESSPGASPGETRQFARPQETARALVQAPARVAAAQMRLHMGADLSKVRARATPAVRAMITRAGPRGLWIGGASLGGFVVLIAILVALTGTGTRKTSAPAAGKTVAPGTGAAVLRSALDDEVQAAMARIERGDTEGGIAALVALEAAHADRADIHRALERAYSAAHRPRDAMREAEQWLAGEPSAAADVELGDDVRRAALERETADDAFVVLEARMGALGVDHLYEMAYGPLAKEHPQTAERARRSLAKPEVRAHAGQTTAVTLDLRSAKSCEAKRVLLPAASEAGDARTLAVLKPLAATSGCGFLSTRDCFPCLHRDGSLARAITALEERTKR